MNDNYDKAKNEATPPSPIVINNNTSPSSGGLFNIGMIVIALVIGLVASQFLDLSSVFPWWSRPAHVAIPENVFIPEVEHLRSLAQLTTTQYNYADVTTGQRDMPAWLSTLYGDSVVMVVVGTIEAGININLMTDDSITFNEETGILSIVLPAAELQSCFLDERKSYVVQRDTAIFADTMDHLEDSVRQSALLHYRDAAIEEGILLDAESAAETALVGLLNILMGDEEVAIQIDFAEPSSEGDADYPANCQ